jgi:multidrug efflux pump subunit AcrA (membrane-fusion protein)
MNSTEKAGGDAAAKFESKTGNAAKGCLPWQSVRPGRRSLGVLLIVVAIGLVTAGRVVWSGPADSDRDVLTVAVARGDLVVTVTEDGHVESATNINVKCEVPGPIRILELVPDGAPVKQGDTLAQLDSSSIEDDILAQEIVLAKAEAAKIKAEKDLSAAEIAVEEYLEGTLVQELHKLDIDLTVARQNATAAESVLQFANKMYKKGYATARERRTKEYALEQSRRDIGLAELKKRVLEKYSSRKTIEELTSARDSARAVLHSETASLQQEQTKRNRLQDQLEKCTLRAPEDGMAIYANDRQNWGEQGPKIEPGARVNQFQAIIRLPDLRKMQVKALVHETKVDQLRPGMPATIKIQDREFEGDITSIANQPDPSGFWQGFIKEYAILVRIAGEPEQLKPGKTAELRILADERKNVLMVPVQCVVQQGTCFYAWVKTPGGIQRRELLLGAKNDASIEIVDGLREGELVLLTPRADSPAESDKI